ncbi:MAG: carbamoyl-phosphate synthase large subunit [Eubacteriales bacterium]|nr:carbamoyl-phosphate synthase large subunit [Eubacteriales bacterium]
MAKRTDIKKVLVIGSGPIVIGQAAEFDYAGTQACLALKEEGYEVVLINSNPATVMTDTKIADKVYMEPLTLEYIAKIIRKERPDAIVPGLGGQTGLNMAVQLAKKGILRECQVEILGTSFESIEKAEDRELFKELCEGLGEPVISSEIATTMEEGRKAASDIGFPVVLRPAFTLGGTGGGFAENAEELEPLLENALKLSPVHQVLVEKSIKGYKEIEFEVMRDAADNAIAICDMENIDPVGIHTGDSMVVAPCQTVSKEDLAMLKASALKILRALKIEGGCNVQFALNPHSSEYFLIEINPRVSRSSALASKATAYPIAKITAKVALGMTLDEIKIGDTDALYEPSVDYTVTKLARFPFDKFTQASNLLSTQMKATGEVMSIGRTMEESLMKGVRGLEVGANHIYMKKFDAVSTEELETYIKEGRDDRLFAIAELLRRGVGVDRIVELTMITPYFVEVIDRIVKYEEVLRTHKGDLEVLLTAKRMGISDAYIASAWGMNELELYRLREEHELFPVYRIVDTYPKAHAEKLNYLYSTYVEGNPNESVRSDRKKILVLGSGPIRIGQGVEFDFSTVHAIWAIREAGYEAIIINNNPETVSTDYTISDKLYFEPLTVEDVMNVIHLEQPDGVIVTLGGQTAINLAERLDKLGVKVVGTSVEAIDRAENRDSFEKTLEELHIPQPQGQAVTDVEAGVQVANRIGYPVLVRPSFVLGGRAMQIVYDDDQLRQYFKEAIVASEDHPVLVDKYIQGKELEVDAICDGKEVLIPGIMQHIERTGVHSGDSISVFPTFSVSERAKNTIIDYTTKLGLNLGMQGLFNIQFIVDENENVYIIEVNPRSSRTVPFLSKATRIPMANIATKVALGQSLSDQGYHGGIYPEPKRWYVKAPVFSFSKLRGADTVLSPEMKSTGEAIGYDENLNRALYKALQAAGTKVKNYGTILVTIAKRDRPDALPLVKRFYDLGFNIEATPGTAAFLKENGIRTRVKHKLSEGSEEILDSLRQGHVTYVINTLNPDKSVSRTDGFMIRRVAVENGVSMFTSLDTVDALLKVLEEITLRVSTIDEEI